MKNIKKLNTIFSDKGFWRCYFDFDECNSDVDHILRKYNFPIINDSSLIARAGCGPQYSIEFHLRNWATNVFLKRKSGRKRLELGWYDPNFMNNIFRWDEYKTLVNYLSRQGETNFDKKYFPTLLLLFTPVTASDKITETKNLVRKAVTEMEVFDFREIKKVVEQIHRVSDTIIWVKDPKRGWVAKGDESYSLRYADPENKSCASDFDFTFFRKFMKTVSAGS
jgi:hypothetical protein